MNEKVIHNYGKLKPSFFYFPLALLALIVFYLFTQSALNINGYIQIQTYWFYALNAWLSRFPLMQQNFTHLGDTFVLLTLLTVLFVRAPTLWETLLSATIVSAIFSSCLKSLFSIPRPSVALSQNTFVIIGEELTGYSSLPSGHSITIFTAVGCIILGFMPKKIINKLVWCILLVAFGSGLAFSRVAVGAHFPLDVVIGSVIGYISALVGIFINKKFNAWQWISNKRYYPFFIALFGISAVILVSKILDENLLVHYLCILSLIISIYACIKKMATK
jgi:membrane-associated phospholipid phosphatase